MPNKGKTKIKKRVGKEKTKEMEERKKSKRKESDARWRANVNKCFDALRILEPPTTFVKRRLSRATIIAHAGQHINTLEIILKTLCGYQVAQAGQFSSKFVAEKLASVQNSYAVKQKYVNCLRPISNRKKRSSYIPLFRMFEEDKIWWQAYQEFHEEVVSSLKIPAVISIAGCCIPYSRAGNIVVTKRRTQADEAGQPDTSLQESYRCNLDDLDQDYNQCDTLLPLTISQNFKNLDDLSRDSAGMDAFASAVTWSPLKCVKDEDVTEPLSVSYLALPLDEMVKGDSSASCQSSQDFIDLSPIAMKGRAFAIRDHTFLIQKTSSANGSRSTIDSGFESQTSAADVGLTFLSQSSSRTSDDESQNSSLSMSFCMSDEFNFLDRSLESLDDSTVNRDKRVIQKTRSDECRDPLKIRAGVGEGNNSVHIGIGCITACSSPIYSHSFIGLARPQKILGIEQSGSKPQCGLHEYDGMEMTISKVDSAALSYGLNYGSDADDEAGPSDGENISPCCLSAAIADPELTNLELLEPLTRNDFTNSNSLTDWPTLLLSDIEAEIVKYDQHELALSTYLQCGAAVVLENCHESPLLTSVDETSILRCTEELGLTDEEDTDGYGSVGSIKQLHHEAKQQHRQRRKRAAGELKRRRNPKCRKRLESFYEDAQSCGRLARDTLHSECILPEMPWSMKRGFQKPVSIKSKAKSFELLR